MTDIRRELGAGADDVIDHLLVDAPPCAPDDERDVPRLPLTDTAAAIKQLMAVTKGGIALDFDDTNVAAILELGGSLTLDPCGPAQGMLVADIRRTTEDYFGIGVHAYCWGIYYVESREHAEQQARSYPREYAGWNEPPPPEKSAEQLDADRRQAEFESAEAAMVAAAARELAVKGAA